MILKSMRVPQYGGSNSWPFVYALRSMRKHSVRTAGIAFMLAIGVALPSTVFTWSSTGIGLAVRDYFDENTYQVRMGHCFMATPDQNLLQISWLTQYRDEQRAALEETLAYPFIERVDLVPNTLGFLSAVSDQSTMPNRNTYWMWNTNYRYGFKDCRVIAVNNDLLSQWENEFDYNGKFSLNRGEVIVSEGFVEYTQKVHGLFIEVGTSISINSNIHPDFHYYGTLDPELWSQHITENLTVVGIYKIKSIRSLIGESFPSLMRANWDPLGLQDPVLGIDDSVMLSEEQFTDYEIQELYDHSLFFPAGLVRGSPGVLTNLGAENIQTNMLEMTEQIRIKIPDSPIVGVQRLEDLQLVVDSFISSRSLVILTFPVLIMSVMLTVFISDLSIQGKKEDIRIIRTKGASYNQVLSFLMWEALFLTILGIVGGILLSIPLSPLMGSSTGLLQVDSISFQDYLTNSRPSIIGLFLGAMIAFYLPCTYILQIARKIDVSELGQRKDTYLEDSITKEEITTPVLILSGIFISLIVMPIILEPTGAIAFLEIVVVTVMLFIAGYAGANVMRRGINVISGFSVLVLGEGHLYIKQSLRKRGGQFVPLFLILTLTMTVTGMTIIQLSSFNSAIDGELTFSLGADLRVECNSKPLDYNRSIQNFPGVLNVATVVQTTAYVGTNTFFLEGVEPMQYLKIGLFRDDCFLNATPESVMLDLSKSESGIIISDHFAQLWNKSVGQDVYLCVETINGTTYSTFMIVGIARSAPGFGAASFDTTAGASFASRFGFQVTQGGFAIVNIDTLVSISRIETSDLLLVDLTPWADTTSIVNDLEEEIGVTAYTFANFDYSSVNDVHLFLTSFQGISSIILLTSSIMGFSSIGFFLSSTVKERETEYAILRAVGAKRNQIVSLAFGEFALTVVSTAIISLILGSIFGYSLSMMTVGVAPFSTLFSVLPTFPFITILLVVGIQVLVMILSCYLPARQAGTVNLSSTLRNL